METASHLVVNTGVSSYDTVLNELSSSLSSKVIYSVAECLRRCFSGAELSSLHAAVVYSLTPEYNYWVKLTWKDGGAEAIALFDVDEDEDSCCNYLVLYGWGKHSGTSGKEFIHSSTLWSVGRTSALKSLLVAQQHLLGRVKTPSLEISPQTATISIEQADQEE